MKKVLKQIDFAVNAALLIAGLFSSSLQALDKDTSSQNLRLFYTEVLNDIDVGLRINLDANRFDGIYREDGLEGYQYD